MTMNAATARPKMDDFSEQALRGQGFEGFVSFKELSGGRLSTVTRQGGIYVVLHDGSTPSIPPSISGFWNRTGWMVRSASTSGRRTISVVDFGSSSATEKGLLWGIRAAGICGR